MLRCPSCNISISTSRRHCLSPPDQSRARAPWSRLDQNLLNRVPLWLCVCVCVCVCMCVFEFTEGVVGSRTLLIGRGEQVVLPLHTATNLNMCLADDDPSSPANWTPIPTPASPCGRHHVHHADKGTRNALESACNAYTPARTTVDRVGTGMSVFLSCQLAVFVGEQSRHMWVTRYVRHRPATPQTHSLCARALT